MGKLKDPEIQQAFQPHLRQDELLKSWAFGVKQPSLVLIFLLLLLAIIPGVIAVFFLTKNYLVGLTDQRLVVLRIKSPSNATVREVSEYGLDEVRAMDTKVKTGSVFTNIEIKDSAKPFKAKFHRAFSKDNRANAIAIGQAITGGNAS